MPWTAPAFGSPAAPLSALFARVPVALTAQQRPSSAPGVDPASVAAVRAKLLDAGLLVSMLIDEGDAMTAFWKLSTPLADLALARKLLVQIAGRLRGDRSMSDLDRALVRIPGSRNTAVYPGRDVVVDVFPPDREYPVDRIQEWLSWRW